MLVSTQTMWISIVYLGMGWDGITISLASRLHKAMIGGEANFIKYEVHFVRVFTLLILSLWEQCEISTGKAIEFLFLLSLYLHIQP